MLLGGFTGCLPEDEPIVLPPPGPLQRIVIPLQPDYEQRVFFDLAAGAQHVVPTTGYDLALEAAAEGQRIFLNGANFMKAWPARNLAFAEVDLPLIESLPDSVFRPDHPSGHAERLALANWQEGSVFVIDRGVRRFGETSARWLKLKVENHSEDTWSLRWGQADDPEGQVFNVPKSGQTGRVFVLFEPQPRTVSIAPPLSDWDLEFTRYIHIFEDQPLDSPTRYYSVTGALGNHFQGLRVAEVRVAPEAQDSAFRNLTAETALQHDFSTDRDLIGYDWKFFDLESGYRVESDRFYILQDASGHLYKLRFLGFLNEAGETGYPEFEYQRL